MRIRIVVAAQNAGWVIGKMGHRLAQGLNENGAEASVGDTPDPQADVNHWMSFAFADGCRGTVNTMFVTHPDDLYKIRLIRERLESAIDMALCMSPFAVDELAGFGVPRHRLWYVLPAMDRTLPPRRVSIGITTRLYDDGRKREKLLVQLARAMPLDAFRFRIFGAGGWPRVIQELERAGAVVEHDPGSDDWQGDYARIQQAIPEFDYYLYTGMDEGSLGTLDAASAGVRTIVTAQGFHLALPGGITHPFSQYEELESIFRRIAAQAAAPAAYADWTWATYAREHLGVWQALLRHRGAQVPQAELEAAMLRRPDETAAVDPGIRGTIASRRWEFYLRMLGPARIRGALARTRVMQPLRRLIGR